LTRLDTVSYTRRPLFGGFCLITESGKVYIVLKSKGRDGLKKRGRKQRGIMNLKAKNEQHTKERLVKRCLGWFNCLTCYKIT
jgi:hypothetical protein